MDYQITYSLNFENEIEPENIDFFEDSELGIYKINYKYDVCEIIDKLDSECPICLNDENNDENNDKNNENNDENNNINIQICCGHKFHKKCFDKWYKESETCPVCRKKFDEQMYKIDNLNNMKNIEMYNKINYLLIEQQLIYWCDECDDEINNINYFNKENKEYNVCKKCFDAKDLNEKDKFILKNVGINENFVLPNKLNKLCIENMNNSFKNINSNEIDIKNTKIKNSNINGDKILITNSYLTNLNLNIKKICFTKNNEIDDIECFENIIQNGNITDMFFENKILNYSKNILFKNYKLHVSNIFNNMLNIYITLDKLCYCPFDVSFDKILTLCLKNIMFPNIPKINKNVLCILLDKICSKKHNILSFKTHTKLTTLSLINCYSEEIILPNGNALIEVTIESCKTKYIKNFSKSLEEIKIYKNYLEILEPIKHLTNLKILYLSRNKLHKITSLPPNITNLHINNNKLKTINIKSCNNLKYFDFSSNYIEYIKFTSSHKIQNIVANNNHLMRLHCNKYCNALYCNYNKITKLTIDGHINILECCNNKITDLNINVNKSYIENLQIKNNPIENITFIGTYENSIQQIKNFNIINTNLKIIKILPLIKYDDDTDILSNDNDENCNEVYIIIFNLICKKKLNINNKFLIKNDNKAYIFNINDIIKDSNMN
jgi:hypothetical protein